MKYHHIGIPTEKSMEGERYIPELGMYVCGGEENRYGVEWIRFVDDAPYPELVRKLPHVAFEVDSLADAIEGEKVIIEPNSPSPGVTVAFIEHHGAPVEFLEIER
jgi:hypothetical protein